MAKHRIALVDDCRVTRMLYKEQIESRIADSEVLTFQTGPEAIDFLSKGKNNIDVFLLDFNLGDMTGLEVAQSITTMYQEGTIAILYPTVIITSSDLDESFLDDPSFRIANKQGIAFLEKPSGRDSGFRWTAIIKALMDAMDETNQERINLKLANSISGLTSDVKQIKDTQEEGFSAIHKAISPTAMLKLCIKELWEAATTKDGKKIIAIVSSIGTLALTAYSGILTKVITLLVL